MVNNMNPICPKCGKHMVSNIYYSVGKPCVEWICLRCGYNSESKVFTTNYTTSTKPTITNRTNK